MSDPVFDINTALGETYEYGGRNQLVPASYYPVILHVLGTGSSKPKMVEVKVKGEVQVDELGQAIMEEGGETPFVKLCGDVYEGPFAGSQIERDCYITPGRSGKGIGRWLGACHAITGVQAQTEMIAPRFGITLPTKGGDPKAWGVAVVEALTSGYFEMDAAKRLAFIAAWLNVVAWDGKQVVAKIGIEKGMQKKRDGALVFLPDGSPDCYFNNNFDGFLPLADVKKGLPWVRAVEFPKQEVTKAAMDAQVAGS